MVLEWLGIGLVFFVRVVAQLEFSQGKIRLVFGL